MTNEHVVSGLIAKRAELAGKIENLQSQLRQTVIEMDHIEAAIRLFDPDIDVAAIGARRVPTVHHAFHGEVSRIVLETLRNAGKPMTTHSVTEAVMRTRGLDTTDAKLRRLVHKRVASCCGHWRRVRGVLSSTQGPGGVRFWEVVPDRPLLAGR